MKSRFLTFLTAIAAFATLAIPVSLVAQEQQRRESEKQYRHRYHFVEVPTFGGPKFIANFTGHNDSLLNKHGTLVGGADTSVVDPFCIDNPDCFVLHAFKFQDGVLTNLDALPGGANSQAFWINAHGQIAGMSQTGAVDPLLGIQALKAVVWEGDNIINLGTLEGGYESVAQSINNRGEVTGIALNTVPDPFATICVNNNNCFFFPTTQNRAFLWKDGEMRDLGTLGGPDAQGIFINDRGQIAGYSYVNFNPTSSGVPQIDPFFWEDGKMVDLGTFGGTFGEPAALNNRGQVVGGMNVEGDLTSHAFLWEKGSLKDLGTLGGSSSFAGDVNDTGEVVGDATTQNDQADLAFFWKNGLMTSLGALSGDDCSIAKAINSRSQVVGTSFSCAAGMAQNAALWENGTVVDLNSFVSPRSNLHLTGDDIYINDGGEIAGTGVLPNGDVRAFLLIPCDENHPGVEGCDYTLADGNATADVTHEINIGSPISNSPAAIFARRSLIQREMLSGPRMTPQFRNSSVARLSAPHNLTASPLNTYQIRINWQEASGQNQTGFNIYRCHGCPSPRTEGTKIASVGPSVLSYTNGSSTSPLTETTSYTYQVTAFNGSGESAPSNTSSAITGTEPAPTNLSSFAFTRGGIDDIVDLHWTNNATDDDRYFLESCSGPTCTNFSVVAQLPANTTSDMQFFQFLPDITFRYRVRAHSPGGFSAYSNIRNQALP